jgi:hypothetical protein
MFFMDVETYSHIHQASRYLVINATRFVDIAVDEIKRKSLENASEEAKTRLAQLVQLWLERTHVYSADEVRTLFAAWPQPPDLELPKARSEAIEIAHGIIRNANSLASTGWTKKPELVWKKPIDPRIRFIIAQKRRVRRTLIRH